MPITAITIENFKGIREPVRVDLKPITLLFGPNSSGKSTIIHALHYAREVLERGNTDPGKTIGGGEAVELGGFESLVYNHDLTLPIRLRFDIDVKDEDLPEYRWYKAEDELEQIVWSSAAWEIPRRIETCWVNIAVKWNAWLEKPVVSSYEVGANYELLAKITASPDARQISLSFFNFEHPVFRDGETVEALEDDIENLSVNRQSSPPPSEVGSNLNLGVKGQNSAMPEWGKPVEFEGETWQELLEYEVFAQVEYEEFLYLMSRFLVGPGEMARDGLRHFAYLGPLRSVPSRSHEPARTPDESLWASGLAAWDVLLTSDEKFVKEVNSWLVRRDRLNSGYQVNLKKFKELDINSPLLRKYEGIDVIDDLERVQEELIKLPTKSRLYLIEEANSIEVAPRDVGVGISQVIPVIVAALVMKSGILAIEQPELHVHPAFQVALGDLFISQIKEKDVAFLLETHSEHLMLRFLRRIRETTEDTLPPGKAPLKPGDLGVYYVEQGEQGITLTSIRINDEGDFVDRWPKGFFSERMEELF